MNNVTGQNLNWFWNGWFFSNGYIDVAVAGADKTGDGYNVRINNVGGMPVPLDIHAQYSDGTTQTVHQSPAMWSANAKNAVVPIATRKTLSLVHLETGIWVDADSTNNIWRR